MTYVKDVRKCCRHAFIPRNKEIDISKKTWHNKMTLVVDSVSFLDQMMFANKKNLTRHCTGNCAPGYQVYPFNVTATQKDPQSPNPVDSRTWHFLFPSPPQSDYGLRRKNILMKIWFPRGRKYGPILSLRSSFNRWDWL